MIENLTFLTFKPYGEIEPKGFGEAREKMGYESFKVAQLTRKVPDKLFVCNRKTVMDLTKGTAVLYVGTSPDMLVPFIFDKTVIIKEGIYYYATPLLQKATISYSEGDGERREISVPPVDMNIYVNPSINIGRIYTLLYHEKEKGFGSKSESHDIWELTYVDSGRMYNVTGDGEDFKTIMKQGDVMLFVPNQRHRQYSDKDVSVCYATIGFEMNYADKKVFENCVFKADNEIKRLMENIISEMDSGEIGSEDLTLCYLKEIIIKLIRKRAADKKTAISTIGKKENDIVSYVKGYINANICEKISVAGIAAAIPVNASYLSTLFKRSTGVALSKYISDQKLIRAKEYIRAGRYSITQVSEQLSFTNVQYFSKLFKKQYGITPSEYEWSIRK
ncbi:MAG: AraC family transcriptional regulator [Clostridia bacterium]|nr:AraC family transcriptional regulator [Clostridia bacterium]